VASGEAAPKRGRRRKPVSSRACDSFASKVVFLSILLITVGSGLADGSIAYIWTAPTPNQQQTFDAFNFAWKTGIGSIFGLLGGRVTRR
jgi:hypothetical protein